MLPPGEAAVTLTRFQDEAPLPALVFNRDPDLTAENWIRENRDTLEAALLRAGAVLFRGFSIAGAEDFSRAAALLCGDLHGGYGDLPRAEAGDRVYLPTHYPVEEPILLHNEGAHLTAWPTRMCFHCLQPAAAGGETQFLDNRLMWDLLDADFRDRLEATGLSYVRNFHAGIDQPWQTVFQETDPGRVTARCEREGIACEWGEDGSLRTVTTVPARLDHPITGEPTFFHQILLFHPSCLPGAVRQSLETLYPGEALPRTVTYGDGTPIPDAPVLRLRDACERVEFRLPWQAGDLAWVDNVRVSHGRRPYSGDRRILVTMGGTGRRSP